MKKLCSIITFLIICGSTYSQDIQKWKVTDVEAYIAAAKDEILVINCWATFCKPCVAEIPSFIRVTDKYKEKGVKLLLVSLDLRSYYPEKIKSFASAHKFTAPIVWLDETNADYFCPKFDPKWSGSLPATLFINTKTGKRSFFEEEMTAEAFEKQLLNIMN